MTWRELRVLLTHLPRDGALARSITGDEQSLWGLREHLFAAAVDQLRIANWQRTKDGQRGRNRPKPIPRPGITDAGRRTGQTDRQRDEVVALLRRIGPQPDHDNQQHEEVTIDAGQ